MARKATESAPVAPMVASRDSRWHPSVPEKLSDLISTYDLRSTPEWQPMDEISSATEFEGIDVSPEDSVVEGNNFVAPGTVYVRLVYEPNSSDRVEFSDSYPARVIYSIDENHDVKLLSVLVDNSSFYQ